MFVATAAGAPSLVLGYYTLSATTIRLRDLPEHLAKRLPRYDAIPATLLGRLAVSIDQQGQGLGSHLLLDALHRALTSAAEVASFAVVVDAKDEAARNFYAHFDFESFKDAPNRLYLPMGAIAKLF